MHRPEPSGTLIGVAGIFYNRSNEWKMELLIMKQGKL